MRAGLYFLIWGTLAFLFNRWSKEQDDSAPRLPGPKDGRLRVLSGPGLVLYMVTLTFMSVDWIMSLDPHFYSTIFGILMLGGQGLSTMAFTILALTAISRFKPMSDVIEADHFHDLGKLMLAFVDAVGLLQRVAAHHHLVRKPAGGDSVVHRSASGPLGADCRARAHRPLHAALPTAVVP